MNHKRTHERQAKRRAQGFTLIEMIIALVIVSFVGVTLAYFVPNVYRSYQQQARASEGLAAISYGQAKLQSELAMTLPESVRVASNGSAIEFVPLVDVAQYDSTGDSAFRGVGNKMSLHKPAASSVKPGMYVVFANAGEGVPGSDVYAASVTAPEQSGSNRRTIKTVAGTTLELDSLAAVDPSNDISPGRVHIAAQPVMYYCDAATKQLIRLTNYGFTATMSADPAALTGDRSVLMTSAQACTFTHETHATGQKSGVATISLTHGQAGGATVSLWSSIGVTSIQ